MKFKIEKDIPMPESPYGDATYSTHKRRIYGELLDHLEVGDSFLVHDREKSISARHALVREGFKVSVRAEGKAYRVWRTG